MLVFFIHFRCGHCKKLAPEYEKAATALANADPPVPLAKVSQPEALHKMYLILMICS